MRLIASKNSRLFELARVLVRFDHVARLIVNANYERRTADDERNRIDEPERSEQTNDYDTEAKHRDQKIYLEGGRWAAMRARAVKNF